MNLTPGQLHRIGQLTTSVRSRGTSGGHCGSPPRADGERWLAVQADSAATQTAAAATALTARMLIRRTTARPGCALHRAVLSRDCALHSPKTDHSSAWQSVPGVI